MLDKRRPLITDRIASFGGPKVVTMHFNQPTGMNVDTTEPITEESNESSSHQKRMKDDRLIDTGAKATKVERREQLTRSELDWLTQNYGLTE